MAAGAPGSPLGHPKETTGPFAKAAANRPPLNRHLAAGSSKRPASSGASTPRRAASLHLWGRAKINLRSTADELQNCSRACVTEPGGGEFENPGVAAGPIDESGSDPLE